MRCLEGITNRHGHCYKLTTKIMLEEPGADNWLLVHGRLHYGPADVHPSLHHAWIDLGNGNNSEECPYPVGTAAHLDWPTALAIRQALDDAIVA